MLDDLKSTIMEKPIVAVVILAVGAVVGFILRPSLRKVLHLKK